MVFIYLRIYRLRCSSSRLRADEARQRVRSGPFDPFDKLRAGPFDRFDRFDRSTGSQQAGSG
jgi:hypothetical protein